MLIFLFQFVPTPKWKLVVDIGMKTNDENESNSTEINNSGPMVAHASMQQSRAVSNDTVHPDSRLINEVITLLGDIMPHDQNSALHTHFPSIMALRLMLLKRNPTPAELECQTTLLSSYESYKSSGRSKSEVAVMVARDYTFLRQLQPNEPSNPALPSRPSIDQMSVALNKANSVLASQALFSANHLQNGHNGRVQQNTVSAFYPVQQNHLQPQPQFPGKQLQVSNHNHDVTLQHLSRHPGQQLQVSNHNHDVNVQHQLQHGGSLGISNLQQLRFMIDPSNHNNHVNFQHHQQDNTMAVSNHSQQDILQHPHLEQQQGDSLGISNHSHHNSMEVTNHSHTNNSSLHSSTLSLNRRPGT